MNEETVDQRRAPMRSKRSRWREPSDARVSQLSYVYGRLTYQQCRTSETRSPTPAGGLEGDGSGISGWGWLPQNPPKQDLLP